jgi:hypothetical protein
MVRLRGRQHRKARKKYPKVRKNFLIIALTAPDCETSRNPCLFKAAFGMPVGGAGPLRADVLVGDVVATSGCGQGICQ